MLLLLLLSGLACQPLQTDKVPLSPEWCLRTPDRLRKVAISPTLKEHYFQHMWMDSSRQFFTTLLVSESADTLFISTIQGWQLSGLRPKLTEALQENQQPRTLARALPRAYQVSGRRDQKYWARQLIFRDRNARQLLLVDIPASTATEAAQLLDRYKPKLWLESCF